MDVEPSAVAHELSFPCVVKPLGLSGSRGVIRADDPRQFVTAFERLRRLLSERSIRASRDPLNDTIIVEGFVAGQEFALEGLVDHGRLRTLALFDKPDPLNGPFFEETIYVTPSLLAARRRQEIEHVVAQAIAAIGLRHGPVHAECRVKDDVVVLEVAARPIGGLCAKALRFENREAGAMSLEELLLRHACGEPMDRVLRETSASGVMMIPIPARGMYRRVAGVDAAGAVPGIEDVRITAKPDQLLVPLPEGASYLGFIFARRDTPEEVVHALRTAHAQLRFVIDREIVVSRQ
jgi:biotin carboxylase